LSCFLEAFDIWFILDNFLQLFGWFADTAHLHMDPRIVHALKQRAAKHGRSVEAEHQALLESVLLQPTSKSFTEMLAAIPNVGRDKDFERVYRY